jgi:predicted small secreted protein
MKTILTLAIALAAFDLAACGGGGAGFGKNGGIATYDDIKAAQKACAEKGGTLRLQKNGDAQFLDDYACEKNK